MPGVLAAVSDTPSIYTDNRAYQIGLFTFHVGLLKDNTYFDAENPKQVIDTATKLVPYEKQFFADF